jgi:DNA invertase Pin-like site-specific DNA recombinase
MRAAAAGRVSTKRQEDGNSLPVQRRECLGYIERESWQLVGEYFEAASGFKEQHKRRELDRLIEDCRAGNVDVVVVSKLDRFGRNLRHLVNLSSELRDLGVRLVFVKQNIDTDTATGRLFFHVLAAIAEFEWETTRERTLSGRRESLADEYWVGGDPPFGHMVVDAFPSDGQRKVPRRLEVNEDEARVVRRAAELLIDEMHSTSKAAEILNAEGLLRRPHRNKRDGQPRRWDSYQLRRILKFESLAGRWTWGKRGSTGETITFAIPPVLDEGRWHELKAVLRKSERQPYAQTNVYPLSGRIESPCGGHYVGFTSQPGKGRMMRCSGKKHAPRCSCPNLRASDVEQAVWKETYDLITDESRLLALAPGGPAAQRDSSAAAKEMSRLDTLIAQKEQARTQRAADALVAGLDPALIQAAVKQIEDDLAILHSQRQEMESWHVETAESEERKKRLRYFAKLAQVLMAPPLHVQHEVFRLLDVQATVVPGEHPKIALTGELRNDAMDRIAQTVQDLAGSSSRRGWDRPPGGRGGRTPSRTPGSSCRAP